MKEEQTIKEYLSSMIMPDGDIFEICKMEYPPNTNQRELAMANYMRGAKAQRDYFKKILDQI